MTPMIYLTVDSLNRTIVHKLLPKLPRDIDLVIGVPRDGILVASLISEYRNIPMTDVETFSRGTVYRPGFKHRNESGYNSTIRKVLIVDDICGSGRAMKEAKAQVTKAGFEAEILTAVVYIFDDREYPSGLLNFYGEYISKPSHYEWTVGDAIRLPFTAFDIDGVLCPDCTREQDDDGSLYVDFLTTAPLKLRPQNIGFLITGRLEKYRDLTEKWLSANGIVYKQLIMRQNRSISHVEHKANAYRKCSADLFIESSSYQAKRIAAITKKPVIGLDTNEIFLGEEV